MTDQEKIIELRKALNHAINYILVDRSGSALKAAALLQDILESTK